jgi:hypothetical protein
MNEITPNLDHISFSSLKYFIKCPRLFYCEKIAKVNPFTGNEHTITGSGVHKAFEFYFSKYKQHSGDVYKQMFNISKKEIEEEASRIIKSGYDLPDDVIKKSWQTSDKMIKNCLPRLQMFIGPRAKVVQAELEIKYNLAQLGWDSDIFFEAHVDLVTERTGEITLWDYKTAGKPWDNQKKTDLEQVTSQLLLYKYFYSKQYGVEPKNIRTIFVVMSKRYPYDIDCWEVKFNMAQLNTMLAHMKNCLDSIKNNNYECLGLKNGCVDYASKTQKYYCKYFCNGTCSQLGLL